MLVAIHHQQLDRAVAAQLQRQPARLLELGGDQRGDGGGFTQQLGDGGLVIAPGLHLLPGVAKMNNRAPDVEAFKEEAANGAGHAKCSA